MLITTPHTKIVPFTDATHFYRLIVDESHLMENSSSSGSWSGKAEHVIARKSTYAWARLARRSRSREEAPPPWIFR